MATLIGAVVGPFAFSLVLAGALFAAWRAYRQPYLAYWAAYWGAYLCVWPTVGLEYLLWSRRTSATVVLIDSAGNTAAFLARALFVLGTLSYLGRRMPSRRGLLLLAAALAALIVGNAVMQVWVPRGVAPAWAAIPFRTYAAGGIALTVLAVVVLRAATGTQAAPRMLLGGAIAAAAISDWWDVFLEASTGATSLYSDVTMQISALGTQVCDALFAAGMLMAIIGTERDRAERASEELRRRDEQLRRAQRLEAVGQLAGGLAHDFNNLLTAITANLFFVRERLPGGDPALEDLDAAAEAAGRAAKLTRQLLTFARRQVVEPRLVDLNESVASLDRMLAPLLGGRIERCLKLAPGLWPVRIDPGQLEQLIINLVLNARDAMPGGGSITVETANLTIGAEPRPVDARDVPEGRWVTLAVQDTGQGMDEATQARIFEPFFTTKPPGYGTGLGLATVHGITLQAGGRVGVRSAPGGGARFAVYLPAEAGVPVPVREPPQAGGRGTETVLLVEDDAAVRAVSARALAAHGYRVVEAPDGRQALRIAEEEPGVALVITDVVMPVMDGWELARALENRHPRLPVLMVSGYAPRPEALEGLQGSPPLLVKPFTPEQLAARVREMLDVARNRAEVTAAGAES